MPRLPASSTLVLGTFAAALLLASCADSGDMPASSSTPTSSESSSAPSPIPTAPPATDDPESTDPATDAPVTTPSPNTTVPVFVTNVLWSPETSTLEVGAYTAVTGEEGSCTLVLTLGSQTLSASAQTVPDVQTTSCGYLAVVKDDMTPGTWSLQVEYSSPSFAGTSEASEVVIP